MARKKWTPQTDVTDALLKSREKRKLQLGYRRYVLEGAKSESYARYFGLDVNRLRQWFEMQFSEGLSWENFGKAWQFEHIIPTAYFDYGVEEDLFLCWNFINIRVEKLDPDADTDRIDQLAAKAYFQKLYNNTGFSLCERMLLKIEAIEQSAVAHNPTVESFIIENKTALENIITLDPDEFNSLNQGSTVEDILLEREILRKFGSDNKA